MEGIILISAEEIKSLLDLEPLPMEGGYYRETYRSTTEVPVGVLPERYTGARPLATAIYYLLTPDTFSALHRLPFYALNFSPWFKSSKNFMPTTVVPS